MPGRRSRSTARRRQRPASGVAFKCPGLPDGWISPYRHQRPPGAGPPAEALLDLARFPTNTRGLRSSRGLSAALASLPPALRVGWKAPGGQPRPGSITGGAARLAPWLPQPAEFIPDLFFRVALFRDQCLHRSRDPVRRPGLGLRVVMIRAWLARHTWWGAAVPRRRRSRKIMRHLTIASVALGRARRWCALWSRVRTGGRRRRVRPGSRCLRSMPRTRRISRTRIRRPLAATLHRIKSAESSNTRRLATPTRKSRHRCLHVDSAAK